MAEPNERRSLVIFGVVTLVMVAVAVGAWRKWGPSVKQQPQYLLKADDFSVPPQPPWIPEDVLVTVVRDGALEGLSIADETLLEKVEGAFAVHTWVAEVTLVRKAPGPKVEVDLKYRRPVAVVEVLRNDGKRGLQPVDADGYVLPTDFLRDNPAQTRDFLRISAGLGLPAGPVGTPWGDPHVAGAARICDELQEHWKQLGIYRVLVVPGATTVSAAQYELQTRGQKRIIWGHMPGSELPGETTASTKVKLLLNLAQSGPLDALGPGPLDIRVGQTALNPN